MASDDPVERRKPSGAARRATSAIRKRLALAILRTLLVLAALEGGAALLERWRPPRPVDIGLGFLPDSRVFLPSPSMLGMRVTDPRKTGTFQVQTFAEKKTPGTFRIAAIGESSVNRLDGELKKLARRLEQGFGTRYQEVDVINAGGNSYGSQRLLLVTTEVLEYEPDVVLIYMGHNEFEEVEQLKLTSLRTIGLQRLLERSALFRLLRDLVTNARIAQLEREHNQRILSHSPDVARAWRYPFKPEDVEIRMEAFRSNLSSMIERCERASISVIIGTIPSNLVHPYLPPDQAPKYDEVHRLIAQGDFATASAHGRQILRGVVGRHQSSQHENEIIRDVADTHHLLLADVEAAVERAEPHHIPGETLFDDHAHLNARGNEILARVYEEQIVRMFSLTKPTPRSSSGHMARNDTTSGGEKSSSNARSVGGKRSPRSSASRT